MTCGNPTKQIDWRRLFKDVELNNPMECVDRDTSAGFIKVNVENGNIYEDDVLIGNNAVLKDGEITYTQVSDNQYLNGLQRTMRYVAGI